MKTKLTIAVAVAALGISISAPAAAAPPRVELAMASYAADVAGENAAARAKQKVEYHAAHAAGSAERAARDCGECCAKIPTCEDCASGKSVRCAEGECAAEKAGRASQAGTGVSGRGA